MTNIPERLFSSTGNQTDIIREAFAELRNLGGLVTESRSKEADDAAADILLAVLERLTVDTHRAALAAEATDYAMQELLMEIRRSAGMRLGS